MGENGTVTLAAAAGKIYYTTEGTDPRRIGGELSSSAIEYTAPFSVDDQTVVKVRALNNGVWSAIDAAAFNVGTLLPASGDVLRVSEVHYHPTSASPEEVAAGFTDADEFEFVELANLSNQPVDLSNVRFVQTAANGQLEGIEFDFGANEYNRLAPGARVVIVENVDAFRARYGQSVSVAGEWVGGLNNNGEALTLMVGDVLLQQFTYDDAWIPSTDVNGPSLEIIDIAAADLSGWNLGSSWQASSTVGGTPGTSVVNRLPGDSNQDGIFNSSDLVTVFQRGEYEDTVLQNSTFEDGDWNGDGDFTTADLVYAFQRATYVAAALRPSRAAAIDAIFGEV